MRIHSAWRHTHWAGHRLAKKRPPMRGRALGWIGGSPALGPTRAARQGAQARARVDACRGWRIGTSGCLHGQSRQLWLAFILNGSVGATGKPRSPAARLFFCTQANVLVDKLDHDAYPL